MIVTKKGTFRHFVSLGGNCYVAEDLIKLGLRSYAYPFDWCLSCDFQGIIDAINNSFEDFVSYDVLLQHEDSRSRYYNEKYMLSFFHDFNKFQSLKNQINDVQEKYGRRINRFCKDIYEPTLFFRYLITLRDVRYVRDNYEEIDSFIKSFCPENEIIYITHSELLNDLPIEAYVVQKDKDDWITHSPLTKNEDLYSKLRNIPFDEKKHNLKFLSENTQNKKKRKFNFEKFIRRLLKKEYIHSKIYRNGK